MAQPIKPIHQLEQHSELFDYEGISGLSETQMALMGLDTGTQRKACRNHKYSSQTLAMLEKISKSQDEVLTAATAMANVGKNAKIYRVPGDINDHDLLRLKTEGLITGSGRAVTLTDMGRVALRDKWLSEENNYRANRKKNKFELHTANNEGAVRTASNKFRKVEANYEHLSAPDHHEMQGWMDQHAVEPYRQDFAAGKIGPGGEKASDAEYSDLGYPLQNPNDKHEEDAYYGRMQNLDRMVDEMLSQQMGEHEGTEEPADGGYDQRYEPY